MTPAAEQLVDRYLAEAARRAAEAEVRLVHERRKELVVRTGRVELRGDAQDTLVSLRLRLDGRTSFVTVPAAAAPGPAVALALAVGRHAPALGPMLPPGPLRAVADRPARPVLADLVDELAAASASPQGAECELRCTQVEREVCFATAQGARGSYRAARASLLFRLTTFGPAPGQVAYLARSDHGPDAASLMARLDAHVRSPCLRWARALARPASRPLPRRLLLDAGVAAQLVGLLARSFSAEAVAHGRSRLEGLLGRRVAAPEVALVDDPMASGLSVRAPFDDEGSPTCRRELVSAGVLAAYLGDRRFAPQVEGAGAGSGWQRSRTSPPAAAASNLWLEPAKRPLVPPGPVLRVVHSQGMHMANEVTGDFSMGATAVVEADGEAAGVQGLTVAGNVFQLLREIEGIGTALHWSAGGASFVAAPDLLVSGLEVGL